MKNVRYIASILIGLFFWVAGWSYHSYLAAQTNPESVVKTIQNDIWTREQEIKGLLANQSLMQHLWENNLSDREFVDLSQKRFILQLYDTTGVCFINNNTFVANTKAFKQKLFAQTNGNDVYLYRSIGNADFPLMRMSLIIPIYKYYEVANNYVKSRFWFSNIEPNNIRIYTQAKQWGLGYPVKSLSGDTLFAISIANENTVPVIPDNMLLALVILAAFFSMLSAHILALRFTEDKGMLWGIGFFVGFMLVSLFLLLYFGLPFDLANSPFFSPSVFAVNEYMPSFGHLFFFVALLYWFSTFILDQLSKFHFRQRDIEEEAKPKLRDWLIYGLSGLVLIFTALYIQSLVFSLVFNSVISFDTNKFSTTNSFTVLALISVALMAQFLKNLIQVLNILKKTILANSKWSYSVIGVLAIAVCFGRHFFYHDHEDVMVFEEELLINILSVLWLLLFCYISNQLSGQLYVRRKGLYVIIFNGVFFSLLLSVYCKYYADQKEKNISRVSFAERLSRQQDSELEIKFDAIANNLVHDSLMVDRLLYGDRISSEYLYKYFRLQSPELFYTRYNQSIYLYNDKGDPFVYNQDVELGDMLRLKNMGAPTLSPYLFFNMDSTAQATYIAVLPLKDRQEKVQGTLVLQFRLKYNISKSAYPALLLSQQEQTQVDVRHYDYATYYNGRLTHQYGNYDFEYRIDSTMHEDASGLGVVFVKKQNFSILYYQSSPGIVYAVAYKNDVLYGLLTFFSFLFIIFLLISILENTIRTLTLHWLENKRLRPFYNVSMSIRIKYFVLGFTVVSFFVIGVSTVVFLTKRYQATSVRGIEDNTRNLSDAIASFLQDQKDEGLNVVPGSNGFISSDFSYFINTISQQQKQDINIFDTNGRLLYTTQEKIYKYNLIAPYMSPTALRLLSKKRLQTYTQSETIGQLSYFASYAPIYAPRGGKLLGYLNVPFFYSQERLGTHIITLVTTLMNIYTILVLISTIITFFFINSLTRSLRLVTDSLKNVNLKKNELIDWPYKDEIGLLVEEYNKMVATVEENARSLVLDERQNAWREMAQQVAHEIKNPLTPMKLNIQYLQQAINTNHPDIINLTKRVSSSIIEQIDNLNYIASEFSNFAKMPENKSERIDLKQMLENVILLFSGNETLTISSHFPDRSVIVFADKSQMLRIFTNIVQNASESIPSDRHGHIEISLYQESELDHVMITVSDNGSGIPDELKEKIFDPYFTTKSSGTGLGLAMTKKIIELWGGKIYFESQNNIGTTFYVTLPHQ